MKKSTLEKCIVGFGKRLLNVIRNLSGIRQTFNVISSPMLAASIHSLLRGRDFPGSEDKTSGCGTFVKKEREYGIRTPLLPAPPKISTRFSNRDKPIPVRLSLERTLLLI